MAVERKLRQGGLAQAGRCFCQSYGLFRERGRILSELTPMRAISGRYSSYRDHHLPYVLDWLELPGLRRQATVELNKGEASNALARAVCFHRLGRLCDRAVEAQQYRAGGLALVTAAIALWSTVYLGRVLEDLRLGGEIVPDGLLAHLAPVGWQHRWPNPA
jgi:hypothetical protein